MKRCGRQWRDGGIDFSCYLEQGHAGRCEGATDAATGEQEQIAPHLRARDVQIATGNSTSPEDSVDFLPKAVADLRAIDWRKDAIPQLGSHDLNRSLGTGLTVSDATAYKHSRNLPVSEMTPRQGVVALAVHRPDVFAPLRERA